MPSKVKWENMTDKKISFIIVNHNYMSDIQQLLDSLDLSISNTEYEVIIVDNASSDGSKEYFSGLNHVIKYIYLDTNIGYGAANNIGVKEASSDLIVLINPDTLVHDKNFDEFIYKAKKEEVGILSPRIMYPDGKTQPNCGSYATLKTYILQLFKVGYFLRKFNLIKKLQKIVKYIPFAKKSFIGVYLDNFTSETIQKECAWVSGACMIIKKQVFESIGGFDENFFLYCEDEDLCRRVISAGYNIYIDTAFTVIHNEGFIKSRDTNGLTFAAGQRYRSNLYYLKKYASSIEVTILRIFYLFTFFIQGAFYMLFDFKASKTYFNFLPILFKKVGR